MTDVRTTDPSGAGRLNGERPPRFEYRVVWQRRGQRRKTKRFASLAAAERRVRLLGPEPWTAYNRDPDEPFCCKGYECSCEGKSLREHLLEQRTAAAYPGDDGMPAVEYIRIERRPLADWENAS